MLRKILVLIAVLLLTNACRSIQPDAKFTPSSTLEITATAPTLVQAELVQPQMTFTPAVTSNILPESKPQLGVNLFPDYMIDAKMDYDAGLIDVDQVIKFTNTLDQSLPSILLAVQPNRIAGVFDLQRLEVDQKEIVNYLLDGQRLTFVLRKPLQVGEKISIHLRYRLNLPYLANGTVDPNWPRFFGILSRQVNLTDWYPMVVPYLKTGNWQLAEPQTIGEHLVYPLANFDVFLKFSNPDAEPIIAASSMPVKEAGAYHYVFENARDFAISMGRRFENVTTESRGVSINSYFFPGNRKAGLAALDTTKKALELYTDLFGEYHHDSLSVVQSDDDDGMEHDGLYYLSSIFYRTFDETPNNFLVLIAAHETSHQWWFGRVASDQANSPWQDEALSTFCEKLFYEKYYPASVSWWQAFRIDKFDAVGWIDGSVSSYGSFKPYTDSVYRRGANYINDLRTIMGNESFNEFLLTYSQQMDGKIAVSGDFFRILNQVMIDQNRSAHIRTLDDLIPAYFSKSPK